MKTTKPYNGEIIKAMAKYNDECAAYATAIKWDWLRRQKVEDITENHINKSCGFCLRWNPSGWDGCYECPLGKIFNGVCNDDGTFYRKACIANQKGNQQAFTEAANNLYYQILSIIDDFYKDDFYKAEPKKEEVFYKKGQRFERQGIEYILAYAGGMCLIGLKTGQYWHEPILVENTRYITTEEFGKICTYGTFTLIEDKK